MRFFQRDAAHAERQQHGQHGGCIRRIGRRLMRVGIRGLPAQPALITFQPLRIAQPQVLMADALAAREQRIGELLDLHAGVAAHVFEPFGRIARRVLDLQHFDAAAVLVVLQHVGDRIASGKFIGQIDRVFQRELGAAADREMRGVRRVAHQHHRHRAAVELHAVHPVAADHTRKANPDRGAAQMRRVADQRVAVQIFGEQLFAKGDCVRLAPSDRARAPSRLLRASPR